MCFFIHNSHKRVKTAKEDIVCYKCMRNLNRKYFLSPYRGYKYEKGELYYENNMYKGNSQLYGEIVNQGLHSYSTYKKANDWKDLEEYIVECVIPKGSKYYYNPTREEYVSDHLKIGTKIVRKEPIK